MISQRQSTIRTWTATVVMFVIAMILAGCTNNGAPPKDSLKQENIVYFKDTRTGVCYAAMNSLDSHSLSNSTTLTYVPCTPEVEEQIRKDGVR